MKKIKTKRPSDLESSVPIISSKSQQEPSTLPNFTIQPTQLKFNQIPLYPDHQTSAPPKSTPLQLFPSIQTKSDQPIQTFWGIGKAYRKKTGQTIKQAQGKETAQDVRARDLRQGKLTQQERDIYAKLIDIDKNPDNYTIEVPIKIKLPKEAYFAMGYLEQQIPKNKKQEIQKRRQEISELESQQAKAAKICEYYGNNIKKILPDGTQTDMTEEEKIQKIQVIMRGTSKLKHDDNYLLFDDNETSPKTLETKEEKEQKMKDIIIQSGITTEYGSQVNELLLFIDATAAAAIRSGIKWRYLSGIWGKNSKETQKQKLKNLKDNGRISDLEQQIYTQIYQLADQYGRKINQTKQFDKKKFEEKFLEQQHEEDLDKYRKANDAVKKEVQKKMLELDQLNYEYLEAVKAVLRTNNITISYQDFINNVQKRLLQKPMVIDNMNTFIAQMSTEKGRDPIATNIEYPL